MPDYPGSLYTKTTVTDDVTDVLAVHHNDQEDEILATQTELGTDVAGSAATLKARLAVSMADDGTLEFADSTLLTISSGAITVTQNFHRIATEGGAGTDDLDTINGLANDGAVLFLRASSSNDVVLKDGVDNIECAQGEDITLADTDEIAVLVYDTNLTAWVAGKLTSGGGTVITSSSGAADSYIAVYTAETNLEGTDDFQWDGTTFTVGDQTAGRDYEIYVNGETNQGLITYFEDEDQFRIDNQISIYTAIAQALKIGSGAAGVDYAIFINGETNQLTLTYLEDEDVFTSSAPVRAATTLYRRYYHLPLGSFDPGAAGATFVPPDGTTIGGYQLDAVGELLYMGADVHSDWDAASDLTVEVKFDIRDASSENDTVDLKLVCYYKGAAEAVTKTQTQEVATNVGDGGVKAQWTQFTMTFTINYDEASNVVQAGDVMHFILNLETDTSEVDDITINSASFWYNTTHIGTESGDV